MLTILFILSLLLPSISSALTCDVYVNNTQSSCTPSVGNRGTGTSGDPYTNPYYALTQGLPGNSACGKTICLKGGTYRYTHSGGTFSDSDEASRFAACDDDTVDSPGSDSSRTVLPLFSTCLAGSDAVITNAPGEDVLLDGSSTEFASGAWTQCTDATHCCGATLTTSLNAFTKTYCTTVRFGFSNSSEVGVWVGGSATTLGGRLGWWAANDSTRSSTSISDHVNFIEADLYPGLDTANPIEGRFAGIDPGNGTGVTIIARLSQHFVDAFGSGTNYDPDFYGAHVTSEDGFYAGTSVISAYGATHMKVMANPAGGSFNARYGYNVIRLDNQASDIVFDGVVAEGCGGRNYGNCIRTANANNITFTNGTANNAAGEVVAFYCGGPGCSDNTCSCGNGCPTQCSNNEVSNSIVKNGGFSAWDGGGIQTNTGDCIKIKSCENCKALNNTVSHCIYRGVMAYTTTDLGGGTPSSDCKNGAGVVTAPCSSDNFLLDGNKISDSGYTSSVNGSNYLYRISYNIDGGCLWAGTQYPSITGFHHSNNGIIRNNWCQGEFAVTGLSDATWGPWSTGIKVLGGSSTTTKIYNNTVVKTTGYGIDTNEINSPGSVEIKNNILDNTGTVASAGGVGIYTETGYTSSYSNNSFSNLTFAWKNSLGTCPGGCTCSSGAITSSNMTCLDANRVASAPTFVSTTNLHLQSGSPQINAGVTLSGFTTDIDKDTRSVWDIGADEFIAGTTTTSTTTTLGTTTTTIARGVTFSGAKLAKTYDRFIDFTTISGVE